MINKTPEQLHEYRSRLKLQLDEAARLEYARDEGLQKGLQKGLEEGEAKGHQKGLREGLEEGEKKGELIGRITILHEILSISQPSREELSTFDPSQLAALAKQLQQQLSRRGQ